MLFQVVEMHRRLYFIMSFLFCVRLLKINSILNGECFAAYTRKQAYFLFLQIQKSETLKFFLITLSLIDRVKEEKKIPFFILPFLYITLSLEYSFFRLLFCSLYILYHFFLPFISGNHQYASIKS